jgi:penicillin amidase
MGPGKAVPYRSIVGSKTSRACQEDIMKKGLKIITCFIALSLLLFVTAAQAAQKSEVTIKRDNYGVPHVYSDTVKGLFYGYGYALAEDRLYQIEMFRRTFEGRLSEVLGEKLLELDKGNRRDNLTEAEIRAQLKALDPEVRTAIEGLAAGINAYIAETRKDPEKKLPKEFVVYKYKPRLWTAVDVGRDFFSVMGLFMDLSAELSNADMLNFLQKRYGLKQGNVMFNDWCWGLDREASTTIFLKGKDVKGNESTSRHLGHPVMASVLRTARAANEVWAKERIDRMKALSAFYPYGHPASYAVVVGSDKSDKGVPLLMGGPQFDFELPSALYEVGLHGGGIDAVGSTLAGYPFIMFGHNRKAAFTSTAGADNIEDIFAEKLNPSNPKQYFFKGKWHGMKVRTEVFQIAGGAQPVKVEFSYTVHGPVFYSDGKTVAFTKQLSCRPRFLQGAASFYRLMKAETVDQFNKAARLSDMSINYFFANNSNNIAYYHVGLHPIRAKGVDDRLPTPGTGEFEWKGFLPKEKNPHQSNPESGYFANWNNQPEPGWRSGDLAATDLWGGWGIDDRVSNIQRLVESKKKISPEDLKGIIKTIAFYDKRTINCKDMLLDAVKDVTPKSEAVSDAIQKVRDWNNLAHLKGGRYDEPGAAIFDRWWMKAVEATFGEWFDGWKNPIGQTAVEVLQNRYLGYILFHRALNGTAGIDYFKGKKAEILYGALEKAVTELAGDYRQMPSAQTISECDSFAPVTVVGFFFHQPITSSVGTLEPFPRVDRGAENHIVILDKKVTGENITAPGASGFISANGTKSPHFSDQVDMFVNFTYKPMLFNADEVKGSLESSMTLKYR